MATRGVEFTGYPYSQLGSLATEFTSRPIETAALENERFRVVVATRLGPRIMEVHDKRHNVPLVLPVAGVNTTMLGLTGAWFPGGIEFNPFRMGHTALFDQDLATDEVRFADEGAGLRFEGLDELVNMRFVLLLRLHENRLCWHVELENLLATGQPLYWWTNIAVPAGEDTMFLYEPGPCLNHALDPGFQVERWPHIYGNDASRWGGQADIISAYFYRYRSPYMGFTDPANGVAMVHCSHPRIMKGRKLWSLGAREHGTAWYARIDGPGLGNYVEMQAGLAPIQPMFAWIEPRQTVRWSESMTAFRFTRASTYAASWSAFSQKADRTSIEARDRALSWTTRSRVVVRPPSWRQEDAMEAVRCLEQSDRSTVDRLTTVAHLDKGWRAGAAWTKVLEQRYKRGGAGEWVRLQYAACLVDRGALRAALSVLPKAPRGRGMPQAQMLRLRGAIQREQGRMAEACAAARSALHASSKDPVLWKEALQYHREAGDMDAALLLASSCPTSVRRSDQVRCEIAWLRFEQADFQGVVKVLSPDMLEIGEWGSDAWALWRESLTAWGLKLWETNRVAAAHRKFLCASQLAPQFGVGRREWDANEIPFFYRWWLAREKGDSLVATALADRLMQRQPHPSSEGALYLLRMAILTRHRSVRQRRRAIRRWQNADQAANIPEPSWRLAMLESMGSGRPSPRWKQLGHSGLMKYRALFEFSHMPVLADDAPQLR